MVNCRRFPGSESILVERFVIVRRFRRSQQSCDFISNIYKQQSQSVIWRALTACPKGLFLFNSLPIFVCYPRLFILRLFTSTVFCACCLIAFNISKNLWYTSWNVTLCKKSSESKLAMHLYNFAMSRITSCGAVRCVLVDSGKKRMRTDEI